MRRGNPHRCSPLCRNDPHKTSSPGTWGR
jgi:hypothetical protein